MNMDHVAAPQSEVCSTCGGKIDASGNCIADDLGSIKAKEAVARLACLAVTNPVDAVVMLMRTASKMTHEDIADGIAKITGKRPRRQSITRKLAKIARKYPAVSRIMVRQ